LAPELAAEMPSLKEVVMSFNEIRIEGALALAKSMKNKDALTLFNLDGNQLGDQTEDIEELMSNFGRIDALAPFDDNEEPDSDEEEDDEEEGEVEEAEANNNHDTSTDEISSHIKGMGLNGHSNGDTNGTPTTSTADDVRLFLKCLTYDSWMKIKKSQRRELLESVVAEDVVSSGVEKLCHTFVHTCCAVEGDNEAIEELAEIILKPAFTNTTSSDVLCSTLLVHLGLLKAELKVEKVDSLKGPLQGLLSVVSKEFFPKSSAAHFIAFLMKPNRLLDACPTERHNLLTKLYQK